MSSENKAGDGVLREICQNSLLRIKTFEKTPFTPITPCEKLRILVILGGEGILRIDGVQTTVRENDVAIICPKSLLAVEESESLRYRELTIEIPADKESAGRYLPFINGGVGAPTFVKSGEACHKDIFYAVTDLINGSDSLADLEKLLAAIFAHRDKNAHSNMLQNKQRHAIGLILQSVYDMNQSVTIGKVAKTCGYSEFYTMKLFKQYVGCSVVDHANKYRIYVAAGKLLSSTESVCAIARSVGFTNISYFNRQFKRMYGKTPKEYRQGQK